MFLQIHFLTSYHASLLNRDDAGLAKRIMFGGIPRLRVSSQCLKRHWREWMTQRTDLASAVRTRHFFSRVVKQRLVEAGMEERMAHTLVVHLASSLLTAAKGKKALDTDTLEMSQPVLFGRPEADYFVHLLTEAAAKGAEKEATDHLDAKLKQGKANIKALAQQAGIDDPLAGLEGALFGRFVTSDILARVDAPVHVAHAFTTHGLDTEVDFFTVVDDLAQLEETGAAHANDMELGSGIFYGYVVVDVPLLVSNLTGASREDWRAQDFSAARELLDLLIQAAVQVTPGAKLGATAPYAHAECLVLETGTSQPRSLANAYLEPIPLRAGGGHPMAQSISSLCAYLSSMEEMHGAAADGRWVASVHAWPREGERVAAVRQAIDICLQSVFGAPNESADSKV